jgi:8-oxo-dGTP pyrophosphatase MutT (NUDIX family)
MIWQADFPISLRIHQKLAPDVLRYRMVKEGFPMADRATVLRDFSALVAHLRAALAPPAPPTDPAALAARPSAVLLPLHAGPNGAPHLLFTERSRALARHSGEISFPGGRRDAGDASLWATALREANEEIGLESARVTYLGELAAVFTVVSNFLIVPQVGVVTGDLAEIAPALNPAEVALVIDAPLVALADPAIHHTEEWLRNGQPHLVYFYQYGPHRIWGATARILADFMRLLPQ